MADLHISRDEKTWMFVSWSTPSAQSLFQSKRPTPQANWSTPVIVAEPGSGTQFPVLAEDSLTLYTFGKQGRLIVRECVKATSPWQEPKVVDGPVNTFVGVRGTWLSSDGRVFRSIRNMTLVKRSILISG